MNKTTIDNYLEKHYIHRSNWLRAAVLGANDGIISISSLAIGVAAASSSRDPILLATMAGLVAVALSMAAGEYVSVSSQTDIESADIEREKKELFDKCFNIEQNLSDKERECELKDIKIESLENILNKREPDFQSVSKSAKKRGNSKGAKLTEKLK